jgi:hypothetical protein
MQCFLDNGADVLCGMVYLILFLYAPFSSTWQRAVLITGVFGAGWSMLRMVTIIWFGESTPPMIGFLIFPLIVVVSACMLRLVKLLVFRISIAVGLGKANQGRIRSILKQ